MMTNYGRETIKWREAAPIAGTAFLAESSVFTEVGKMYCEAKTLLKCGEYILTRNKWTKLKKFQINK